MNTNGHSFRQLTDGINCQFCSVFEQGLMLAISYQKLYIYIYIYKDIVSFQCVFLNQQVIFSITVALS